MPGLDGCNVAVTPFEPGMPAYHVGEWTIYADSAAAVVDGITVYASIGHWPLPSAIWMGSIGSPCCSYTELSVDFAEVQVFTQPVPIHNRSWGQVKTPYR
jgi:hypothetical protein